MIFFDIGRTIEAPIYAVVAWTKSDDDSCDSSLSQRLLKVTLSGSTALLWGLNDQPSWNMTWQQPAGVPLSIPCLVCHGGSIRGPGWHLP
jgi:hypothetical protein